VRKILDSVSFLLLMGGDGLFFDAMYVERLKLVLTVGL